MHSSRDIVGIGCSFAKRRLRYARHAEIWFSVSSRIIVKSRYRSGYDIWAFEFVPDRSWRRQSGIASKESDWDGRTRLDWTTWSGDAGTCNVRKIYSYRFLRSLCTRKCNRRNHSIVLRLCVYQRERSVLFVLSRITTPWDRAVMGDFTTRLLRRDQLGNCIN